MSMAFRVLIPEKWHKCQKQGMFNKIKLLACSLEIHVYAFLIILICRLQNEFNWTLQSPCEFLFSICLLFCLCSLLLLSCLLLSILLWSFLNSSWLLSLGVLFCCYRCISSQVFIYSFIPYRWFKQFSSIRKSSKPMVRMPFSSLHGLMSSFTTMTFLKVSLILRREAVYFSLRRFFGNIATFSS